VSNLIEIIRIYNISIDVKIYLDELLDCMSVISPSPTSGAAPDETRPHEQLLHVGGTHGHQLYNMLQLYNDQQHVQQPLR